MSDKDANSCPFFSRDDAAWLVDSGAVIAHLHKQGWRARSDTGLEVLSHAMVKRVLQGKQFKPAIREGLSAGDVPAPIDRFLSDGLLPAFDGERHKRIRRAILSAFAAREIENQRGVMQSIAHRLIDAFAADGNADLVGQFSHRFPIEVVASLIGVPQEDIDHFEKWTVGVGHLGDHPIGAGYTLAEEGIVGIVEYLERFLRNRRCRPADDLMSALIQQCDECGDITESEVIYNMLNLLMAGHDTTRFQLASTIYLLLSHPDQFAALRRDPALIGNAIEESMRLLPAIRRTFRFPRDTMTVEAVTLASDELLVANMEAANLDPGRFADPQGFDIFRKNASDQLTFGSGPHLCAGAGLARAEMREALAIIVERLEDLKLAEEPEFLPRSGILGGPSTLRVTFRAASPNFAES